MALAIVVRGIWTLRYRSAFSKACWDTNFCKLKSNSKNILHFFLGHIFQAQRFWNVIVVLWWAFQGLVLFSYSLISGSKLARSGVNPMMVLCCFPGEHFKQSWYSLDKYSKKFLSVKSLKHFKSSFAYKHSIRRSDGKFMWLATRGGKSAISLLHGRLILPAYFHFMCNQALYLPAWSTLSFKLPLVTYFFSCNSLILGHPGVSPVCMFLR